MQRICYTTLMVLLTVALSASGEDHKDLEALQGDWVPTSAELGGKPMADEVRKSIKLTIKEKKYTVTVGKNPDHGTIEINPTTKPKSMEITGSEGPNKGKKIPAIYEIDGDTIKICYDLSGKKLPTEFKSLEGTQLFLVTYKREKR